MRIALGVLVGLSIMAALAYGSYTAERWSDGTGTRAERAIGATFCILATAAVIGVFVCLGLNIVGVGR